MHNAYPGGQNGAPRVDEFVYRRVAELLSRGRDRLIFDPESAVAQAIQARTEAMTEKGMDPYRVAVISSKAQIDHSAGMYLRREAALEDVSDH